MKSLVRVVARYLIVLFAGGLVPFSSYATVQTMMPDFYAEPGLNPFRGRVSANVNEVIDTFSGSLTLTHTDLVIPGNGGLDIKIQRSYNSNNVYDPTPSEFASLPYPTYLSDRTPYGLGWTMHFGRLLGFGTPILCSDSAYDNLDNPILELPDGSHHILFRNGTSFSAYYITKEQWVASCASGGLVVISPDGTKYTMNQALSRLNTSGTTEFVWYTTRIEDRNGNWIQISYDAQAGGGTDPIFNQITSSDGRTVGFTYLSRGTTNVRLSNITANTQTWTYQYTQASGSHYYCTNFVFTRHSVLRAA